MQTAAGFQHQTREQAPRMQELRHRVELFGISLQVWCLPKLTDLQRG